ncbi:snare-complex protein syntaxin-18 N-terminus-domain-containing protein [Scheffersomyces amazonensis]|uniref:snare-complex protein syntaxin-18 N-terminus-domain-containing protein n=1 Tax=Scheffersomyces amazonensis TaxID=1078765 RepID=UPI00315DB1AF
MTDLTPLFNKCVEIVASELPSKSFDEVSPIKVSTFSVNDTFIKECIEVYDLLTNLNTFIQEMKSQYLAINDEQSGFNRTNELTSADKDSIDEEFKYKVRQLYQKLSFLENYESKRQSLDKSGQNGKGKGKGWFDNVFGDNEPSDHEIFLSTIGQHRNHILKFLMIALNATSKKFESIQKKRQTREKQLDSLNFQNFEEDEYNDFNLNEPPTSTSTTKVNNTDFDDEGWGNDDFDDGEFEEEEKQKNDIVNQLSQEQIQELELENKDFLNMKTNQLKQVQKVQQSIIDIVNIQNELSFKLQSQEEQINTLMENNAQVHVDVHMGNKQLNKATTRNKRGANMLVSLCIILGILILLIDYISF